MLLTYGHGTETAERSAVLLADAGTTSLVDIRTVPGSRRHPQFARTALEEWLPVAGIAYRWEKRLGGFRRPGRVTGTPSGARRCSAVTPSTCGRRTSSTRPGRCWPRRRRGR
ncbi:MAG TPA: DUF488 domain-containing protein [Trebonia sp.]